jgi:hypothetical protein
MLCNTFFLFFFVLKANIQAEKHFFYKSSPVFLCLETIIRVGQVLSACQLLLTGSANYFLLRYSAHMVAASSTIFEQGRLA